MPPSIVKIKRRLMAHTQQGGSFTGSDLRSAQAFQSIWEGVSFQKAMLSMGDYRASKWVHCGISDTGTWGANFSGATLHDVVFERCDGEQMSFAGAVLRNVVFRDCRLAYSSFVNATLDGVVFERCNLRGADLDMAESTGVGYLDCNLWSAKTAFGCAFWESTFSLETCNRFAAMLARIHPDQKSRDALVGIAGERTYRAVCRLMDSPPDGDTPDF